MENHQLRIERAYMLRTIDTEKAYADECNGKLVEAMGQNKNLVAYLKQLTGYISALESIIQTHVNNSFEVIDKLREEHETDKVLDGIASPSLIDITAIEQQPSDQKITELTVLSEEANSELKLEERDSTSTPHKCKSSGTSVLSVSTPAPDPATKRFPTSFSPIEQPPGLPSTAQAPVVIEPLAVQTGTNPFLTQQDVVEQLISSKYHALRDIEPEQQAQFSPQVSTRKESIFQENDLPLMKKFLFSETGIDGTVPNNSLPSSNTRHNSNGLLVSNSLPNSNGLQNGDSEITVGIKSNSTTAFLPPMTKSIQRQSSCDVFANDATAQILAELDKNVRMLSNLEKN